jgi:hypothetical protein
MLRGGLKYQENALRLAVSIESDVELSVASRSIV